MNEPRSNSGSDWKLAIRGLADRLHRDYALRVSPFAQGLDVWGNSTTVGFEIRPGPRFGLVHQDDKPQGPR